MSLKQLMAHPVNSTAEAAARLEDIRKVVEAGQTDRKDAMAGWGDARRHVVAAIDEDDKALQEVRMSFLNELASLLVPFGSKHLFHTFRDVRSFCLTPPMRLMYASHEGEYVLLVEKGKHGNMTHLLTSPADFTNCVRDILHQRLECGHYYEGDEEFDLPPGLVRQITDGTFMNAEASGAVHMVRAVMERDDLECADKLRLLMDRTICPLEARVCFFCDGEFTRLVADCAALDNPDFTPAALFKLMLRSVVEASRSADYRKAVMARFMAGLPEDFELPGYGRFLECRVVDNKLEWALQDLLERKVSLGGPNARQKATEYLAAMDTAQSQAERRLAARRAWVFLDTRSDHQYEEITASRIRPYGAASCAPHHKA